MLRLIISKVLITFILVYLVSCTENDSFMQGIGPIPDGAYYVATWGKDSNPGTFESPWATWQKAFDAADQGDTVYFRGGVYLPSVAASGNNITIIDQPAYTVHGHDGTAENPVCFFNYPGESPILDCKRINTTGNYNTGLLIDEARFLKFRGLTIRNVYQRRTGVQAFGILAYGCANFNYENITVHNVGGNGIRHFGGMDYLPGLSYDSTFFINCDVYNCADTFAVTPGNAADGYKTDNEKGGYFYFEGCRSWHNSDDGFDQSGPDVAVYYKCWSFSNGYLEGGNGNGFKSGGLRDSISEPGRIMTHCLIAFNKAYGLHSLDYTGYYRNNARIYNNTSFANLIGFVEFANTDRPFHNSVYKNNLSYKDGQITLVAQYSTTGYPESHNTWDFKLNSYPGYTITDSVTVNDADFISVIPKGLSGPRKADGSLPDVDFLHLAKGSDLINAGTNIGKPYKGLAPDIGAFEKE
jgi:hypothetical protein